MDKLSQTLVNVQDRKAPPPVTRRLQKHLKSPKLPPVSQLSLLNEEGKRSTPTSGSDQEAPLPDIKTLKQQLQSCLTCFKDPIAIALESLKISGLAKTHFSAIAIWLGDQLTWLET